VTELQVLFVIVPVLIVVCAVLVARFKDLLHAVIALGALSLLLAVLFYMMQAPDVAIAEAGIGAAITTAVYVFALRATKRNHDS
jgi:energy-converting hydrogenase B subunit D